MVACLLVALSVEFMRNRLVEDMCCVVIIIGGWRRCGTKKCFVCRVPVDLVFSHVVFARTKSVLLERHFRKGWCKFVEECER